MPGPVRPLRQRLSRKTFIMAKLLHGIWSAVLVYFIVRLFWIVEPVRHSCGKGDRNDGMSFLNPDPFDRCSFCAVCLILFSRGHIFAGVYPYSKPVKKSGKKKKKKVYNGFFRLLNTSGK
jgi:hypothetical protein